MAAKTESMVMDGGYIYWWDAIRANSFAGSDTLYPSALFRHCKVMAYQMVSLQPSVKESLRFKKYWFCLATKYLQTCAG
jgi:hypothetical protein